MIVIVGVICFFIGSIAGVTIMGICVASKYKERRNENE
jgi:hypothetical protein